MRALLVSDLHYDLRKLDWVLSEAAEVDLLVVAGDLLDIAGALPLDAQTTVVLEYLGRCAERTTTVACSGNHDLDHRNAAGEKATGWLVEARSRGAFVDGDTTTVGGWRVTACPWWEGPDTLQRMERRIDEGSSRGEGPWIWAYHGPPEGPLSWTGARHYGDPELPRLIDRHRPDIVMCGHIHQAPYVVGGAWSEQRGSTWLFNSGHQSGPVPAHVRFDLDLTERTAAWWSFEGSGEGSLLGAEPAPSAQ
jgi:Icc-related predicted phosphoesterase